MANKTNAPYTSIREYGKIHSIGFTSGIGLGASQEIWDINPYRRPASLPEPARGGAFFPSNTSPRGAVSAHRSHIIKNVVTNSVFPTHRLQSRVAICSLQNPGQRCANQHSVPLFAILRYFNDLHTGEL